MTGRWLLIGGILGVLGAASAGAGETVRYPSGPDTVSAYLARPDGDGPFPAVILIHEWWGLDDWVRENADEFARRGYVALAVDLYRGRVTQDPAEAHELSRGLPEERALQDLKAAIDYLRGRPDVQKDRIGVTGWCMGGGYALRLALTDARIRAVNINYGRLVFDEDRLRGLTAELLGIFAEQDRGIPPADVQKFEGLLQRLGKKAEIHVYPGVGHAFMTGVPRNIAVVGRALTPREQATVDAWSRIFAFFDRTLKE